MNTKFIFCFYILILSLFCISCQEKRFDRFERECREYTEKHCPQYYDGGVTLDSMVFDQSGVGTVAFYYTVSVAPEAREGLMGRFEEVRSSLLSGVRNSIDLKKFKDSGVSFMYVYVDADNKKLLTEFLFTSEDY